MCAKVLLASSMYLRQDPVEHRLMQPYFPLGILYLAAALRARGHEVSVFDPTFCSGEKDFEPAIREFSPDWVGVSALTTTRRMAVRMGRLARSLGRAVVSGGPDPTTRAAAYLLSEDGLPAAADVVVNGEGEETLAELVERLDVHDRSSWEAALPTIQGVTYADPKGNAATTPPRPLIADLDALPFPARDLIDVERHQEAWRARHGYSSLSLITSRGCPYGCTWCSKPVFGRTFRQRSAANVAEEMRQVKEQHRPDQLRIVDDLIGLDRRWIEEWRDEVVKRDAAIPFECLSRTNLVGAPMLGTLKEIGCRRIYFGVESGSQRVLDAMKKGTRVEDALTTAQAMREAGLEMHFYVMLGYPGEEPGDIRKTVELLTKTIPDGMSTTVAYPLPGTEFYDLVKDRLVGSPDWSHSGENLLLYRRGAYSTLFYRWAQRLLQKELAAARLRAGKQEALPQKLKLRLSLILSRLVVSVLGIAALSSNPTELPRGRIHEGTRRNTK